MNSQLDQKVLVIASAGGHLTQAMCATSNCGNIILVSNKRNLSNGRVRKFYQIWDTQKNPFIHFVNFFFAVYVLLRERPYAVFSTGGPIALPFALVCKLTPLRFVYLDTLSRVVELSNTGELIKRYNLFDRFYCQWPRVAEANGVEYIGKCFDIMGENTVEENRSIDEQQPMILVTVGTNDYPFPRVFEAIEKMPLYNDMRVRWVVQAGDNVVHKKPANGELVTSVTRDVMEGYIKNASLVISHCGIGSINLMLSYQKQVIFIPRLKRFGEFSDDHQLQIAQELNTPFFSVLMPDIDPHLITYDGLVNFGLVQNPVDITNYRFASEIKSSLEG